MQPITIYLILALICVTVGFIAGALVAMAFSEREKKQMRNEGDLLPQGIDRDHHTALLRLWRAEDGTLLTELNGRLLSDVRQASTAQRLDLEALTEKWLNWLGLNVQLPKPPDPPRPQPAVAVAPPPAPAAFNVNPVAVSPVPAVIEIPGIVPPPPAVRPKSMVEQIDEILQDMLSQSPLRQHSLKITQDLREGIVVWLDSGRYVGVDGVPDAEVQKLIRAAAAEWERRSERGV